MNKTFKILLSLFIFSVVCSACAFAKPIYAEEDEEYMAFGKWGDNITWTIDWEGNLVFKGKGLMRLGVDDYDDGETPPELEEYPWVRDYCEVITSVTFGEGITNVPPRAFHDLYDGYESLKTVKLSSTITEIGHMAFDGCPVLESINFPKKLKKIGNCAFIGCQSLKKIAFPDSLREIGQDAFLGCNKLKAVVIPGKVKRIGSMAFASCQNLKSVIFKPNSNKSMSIGRKCFSKCKLLEEVILPDNVRKLDFAFWYCTALTTIKLPKKLEVMSGAFSNCYSLQKITVPASVKRLEDKTFYKCKRLKKIVINSKKLSLDNWERPELTFQGIAKDAVILLPASKYKRYKAKIELSAPENVKYKKRN